MTEQRGGEEGKHDGGEMFEKGSSEMQIRDTRTTKREEMLEEERKGKRERVIEGEHRRDTKYAAE